MKRFQMTALVSGSLLTGILGFYQQASAGASYVVDQDVTAYTASSGAKTYYGTTPTKYVTIAVKPNTCGDATSGTRIPYNTYIYIDNPSNGFYMPDIGQYKSTFRVEDMGQVNCSKFTPYWFDIFFGDINSDDFDQAVNFGVKKADYHWYF